MKNKLRLSHSQISTYKDCARKWFLDKQKRLRPNWRSSALLMGSAMDEAVEHILLKKEGTYVEAFLNALKKFDVNGVEKSLPENILDVRFTAGDVDIAFLEGSFFDFIAEYCDELKIDMPDLQEFLDYCKQQRKNKDPLDKVNQKLYNYIAYTSVRAKGLMMLEKVSEWIEENVAEVHEVQKRIEIENEDGDKFVGYLDFIVTMKTDCETCGGDGILDYEPNVHEMGGDYPEFIECPDCSPKKVLIDLKTSSNTNAYYPPQSATESVQLGIYSQEEGIEDVAYLVADKKIRKRDPRVRLAFIEGKITEEHLDEVFEGIEEATNEIKEKLEMGEGAFEKNLDSCFMYSGCQYFSYCKKGCMKGLEYVKK